MLRRRDYIRLHLYRREPLSARELAKRTLEEKMIQKSLAIKSVIVGSSMGKSLPERTQILITYIASDEIERGMIVYIRDGERRIAHRLIFRLGPIIIEKGDALGHYAIRKKSDVIGSVVAIGLYGI